MKSEEIFKCMNGSIRNEPKKKKEMSNEEFPISNKLGLKDIYKLEQGYGHYVFNGEAVFKAKDVEALLQSAQVVYGYKDAPHFNGWNSMDRFPNKNPTHQAILLGIEPYKKKTKAEAALELLEKLAKDHDQLIQPEWHVKEAKRILEMKD